MTGHSAYIYPDWPAPNNVFSVISTRRGGSSKPPFDTNNFALHVDDEPETVLKNRGGFVREHQLPECIWLNQTHSVDILNLDAALDTRDADGCTTRAKNFTCAVMTADCLPLLVCDRRGSQVAAIHAGWRGLANGVIRHALASFRAKPEDLMVYLGPAISQRHFEVGVDVKQGFKSLESLMGSAIPEQNFLPNKNRAKHYFADLYGIAKWQLNLLGVSAIYGGQYCTYSQEQLFYSYRRQGVCGRMVSAICLMS